MTINETNGNANNQRYVEVDGEMVAVSEEVYQAYKRPLWKERKRKERDLRCLDENGYRCTKDCRLCDKERTSRVLSLNKFAEDELPPLK